MFARTTTLFLSALCAGTLLLSSCEGQKPTATTPAAPAPAATAPAATPVAEARYECPMGCAGSQSDKPGKCPTCGMDLEKKS